MKSVRAAAALLLLAFAAACGGSPTLPSPGATVPGHEAGPTFGSGER